MSDRKILFPTDFSAVAGAGLAEAVSLARAHGATLVMLHVQKPIMGYDGLLEYGPLEVTSDLLRDLIRQVMPASPRSGAAAADQPVHVVPRLSMGDPATEIVRLAHDDHVDLIVMGTHGRSGLSRYFMGSVAEDVIRRADCPVLAYRAVR
jgi:nucleotide-binding universal stress UspA family protein